eukprot:CAMPEP_0176319524 /NCGR_PEP_ID=MMETSP0121_2-20121125/70347_1 /TAXON_ID=160619 /ORGANISM="Kryptoperidinium foliaceum, Strain CCMP 1326" /LENGTH=34 /DNA_ID= /DNA_START= /DNA_END= /DNA_ORIENTATION=
MSISTTSDATPGISLTMSAISVALVVFVTDADSE